MIYGVHEPVREFVRNFVVAAYFNSSLAAQQLWFILWNEIGETTQSYFNVLNDRT